MLNEYLASLPDLGTRPQTRLKSADFSLQRIRSLLAALGDPQAALPGLHIAGTHGKGSVAALCSAALSAAGYRVAGFTSPHGEGALAGISLAGQRAAPAELEATFAQMLPHLEGRSDWTHFEVVVALAFFYFARQGAQVAVVEAGLGGLRDATNVWTPSISLITPVDYDHTSILGDTLGQIAAHKAGIIKPGIPLALAPQVPEARAVILQAAQLQGAQVKEVGRDLLFAIESFDSRGQSLCVWPAAQQPRQGLQLRIRLLGRHQAANAATACAAFQLLDATELPVPDEAIQQGFAAARWPGRFELLGGDPPLLLDAAHSPGAAAALRQALDDYFPTQELVLLLGVSADKDLAGLLDPLRSRVAMALATQSRHPRAMPSGQLAARLAQAGLPARVEPDAAAALAAAREMARPDQLVLVCGSVFLVELVRQLYTGANPLAKPGTDTP